ncbi:MAG: RNA polymerase sigma factor SigZ [Thermoanaerobaculia bacterium]
MSIQAADPAPPAWQDLRSELVRFVRSRVGDEAAADDIVHDVLLRAWRELQGPEPPVHLRGWLYRVTRNSIVDHYRSRRPTEELPEEVESAPRADESPAERELAGCLAPLLDGLPAPYRLALSLSEVEGLPQRELARREGLSLSGAKSRVQRARRMLREALLGCCRVEIDRRGGVVDFQQQPGGPACVRSAESRPGSPPETSAGCGCQTSRRTSHRAPRPGARQGREP